MAFFCDKTGVRIVAPGISKSAGGVVPEHDGSEASIKAEDAALEALRVGRKSAEEIASSTEAKAAAVSAAIDIVSPKPETKPDAKPEPAKPEHQAKIDPKTALKRPQ